MIYSKGATMKKFSEISASLVGEIMTKLQCDGSSGYAFWGGGAV